MIHRLCITLYVALLPREVSFILYCGMISYDTIIDDTTLFYDIITQIKPLL